ncbi:glycosyltransferase family 2 protein [Myroides odoratimimus]|uniref:glycosyltransferase family 2 protein n=1 Tax=Myroides odoratimimus TaxID=76832 RepID=UPI001CE0A693|nr:glycosyltransferase family 2 protein [Myroides odoratimimus]MCA4806986.1 glycosyltransferase family 2 protein [Myroides odoratimimus]
MFLSIIIPAFNAENKILTCLNSIFNQSIKIDFEVVIVDDGSSIPIEDILNDYSVHYNNLKIYRQKNCGVSVARNKGLELAVGELVWFIDADDWIALDSFEIIQKEFKKSIELDILEFDYCTKNRVDFEIGVKDFYYSSISTSLVSSREYFCTYGCSIAVTNKVFRREVLNTNRFKFPDGVKMSEELVPVIKLYLADVKVKKILNCLYFYLLHTDSVTHNITKESVKVYNNNILELITRINSIVDKEDIRIKSMTMQIQCFLTMNFLYMALKLRDPYYMSELFTKYENINLYPIPQYSFHNRWKREIMRKILNRKKIILFFLKIRS